MDVSPDQSMLDEGIAREVINRVQKLRKKVIVLCASKITGSYKQFGINTVLC